MATQTPLVTVSSGQLKGENQGNIAVFKGVPYAQPPVGDLRWRPPQPVEPWSGVKEATKFSSMAIQRMVDLEVFVSNVISGQGWGRLRTAFLTWLFKLVPLPSQSEDCLYLNVRTPDLSPDANLPVMVWIHGGDHQDGSGSDVYFDANTYAENGCVYVTINYRLGLFGYMSHPELTRESENGVSGNYGTLDQIAALKWIQENISAFGGNPNDVTIFGESAGGESVIHLMTSPLSRGLFHKAIAQSPANSGQMVHLNKPFLDFESNERLGEIVAEKMGIPGDNQIGQMRKVSADDLYALMRTDSKLGNHYPCIDGYVFEQTTLEAFANGEQMDIPFMIGTNGDEGGLVYEVLPTILPEYRYREQPTGQLPSYMQEAFPEDLDELISIYNGLENGDVKAKKDLLGDYMFGVKAYFYALQSDKKESSTYLYMFSRTPPSPTQTAGAYHAAELPFVHGTSVPILPLTNEDKGLSSKMIAYWANFAKTGDPNGAGLEKWDAFDPQNPNWINLNHRIKTEAVSRQVQYAIFIKRIERLMAELKQLRETA